ncbi:transcription antitermination factor NusB [Paenibacillus sp. ACRRX]|uniref:transcription antitermination factor NusB n=1 Tax=unclassified Paenibacillus TaxID=185978 RepID=UPI001EF55C5A|nr:MULTISPECIES: transcription antitermination factor NusB [unclassified Paenibacillus]MCG7406309.1 transcription antitermination factor NusB [Paenibacillus sp. ACRRX]MDK8179344.1 transcription antitermination factor NusB [Paenibacillus sp. UMB4589-SE434]
MKRRIAREMAIQSLYQLEMTGITPEQAVEMVVDEAKQEDNETGVEAKDASAMREHVLTWVHETWAKREDIDFVLTGYLKGWQVDRLSRVDRQILRLASYELLYRDDVPPKVIVNEAVVLAKHFGTDESGKFVNGVLGQMLRDRNPSEAISETETGEGATSGTKPDVEAGAVEQE